MVFRDYLKRLLEGGAWRVEFVDGDPRVQMIVSKQGMRYAVLVWESLDKPAGVDAVRAAHQAAAATMCYWGAVVSQSTISDAARREAAALEPPVHVVGREDMARLGIVLDVPPDLPPEPVAGAKKRSRKKLLVAAAGAVVAGAGAFVYLNAPPPPLPAIAATTPAPTASPTPAPAAPAPDPFAADEPAPAPQPDNTLTDAEIADGWKLLFDGETLEGWRGLDMKKADADVFGGTINPSLSGEEWLVTEKTFADFELVLDYKISPGYEGGFMVRLVTTQNLGGSVRDYGLEIAMDDRYDGGYQAAGGVRDFVAPTENAAKPAGEWNRVRVFCFADEVNVELNGKPTVRMKLDEWTEVKRRPDGSPHRHTVPLKRLPRRGRIALPQGNKSAQFKNIKARDYRPLKTAG